MKRRKPYEVKQIEDGTFAASGSEPIDSPPIALRLTTKQYAELEAIAGKKKAQWIREAIALRLNLELEQTQLPTSGPQDEPPASKPAKTPSRRGRTSGKKEKDGNL